MKPLLLIVPCLLLADTFEPNLRVQSTDFKVTYSSKVDIFEFNSSKFFIILEQTYDFDTRQRTRYNSCLFYRFSW